jgi:hypothetical protein
MKITKNSRKRADSDSDDDYWSIERAIKFT